MRDLVLRDADAATSRIPLAGAGRPRLRRPIWTTILAAIGLTLAVQFVPRSTARPIPPTARPEAATTPASRAVREAIAGVEGALQQLPDDDAGLPALDEPIAALEALGRQMSDQPAPPPADTTAAELAGLADRLAEQAQQHLEAADELARRFGALPKTEPPADLDDLMDALRRGAFADAASEVESLLHERSSSMTEDERNAAAQALRDASRSAGGTAGQDPAEARERAERLAQAMRDQGLDEETVRRALDGQPPEDRAWREHGVDPELASEFERDIERLARQRRTQGQADRDAGAVADALRRAAEALERPPSAPDAEPPPQAGKPAAEGEATTPPGTPQHVEAPQRRRGDDASPSATSQPRPGAGSTPGAEHEDGRQPTSGQSETPAGAADPGAHEQPSSIGDREPGATPREPGATPTPGAESHADSPADLPPPDADPGAAPHGPGDEPSPRAAPAPQELLRRVAERREQANELERRSRRLKDIAHRLAETSPPPAGEPGADDAGAGPGWSPDGSAAPADQPAPPAPLGAVGTEPLEIAGEGSGVRWAGDLLPGSASGPVAEAPAARRIVRQAREVAERAVDDSMVPNRYHRLIRRYFRRLDETVQGEPTDP
jgi:hypothetical protein